MAGCGPAKVTQRELFGGRSNGVGRRKEDKAVANKGEALQREFGLKKLIVGAGEKLCPGAGHCGNQVVDRDRLAVEGALLVAVGRDLNGGDGADLVAYLLGENGPKAGTRVGWRIGEIEKRLKGSRIEVGEQDGGGMEL